MRAASPHRRGDRRRAARRTHGCKDATLDPAALLTWPRGCNVGIVTGGGLVVLDVDEDGADSLHELERAQGSLPETPTVKTGNGQHYYFAEGPPQPSLSTRSAELAGARPGTGN